MPDDPPQWPEAEAERITYGDDPSQWVDLHTPDGESRGLVVVIHGGFWKAEYGAEYGAPLAEDLVGRGWTAANVEYRRVGNGGGFPETLDDIHAAIGAVAKPTPTARSSRSATRPAATSPPGPAPAGASTAGPTARPSPT